MRVTSLRVKNFRVLKDVQLSLSKCTVILGENSAGKTALLDALKIALGRRWGTRGTGFTEYDFYQDETISGPSSSAGIVIELTCEEEAVDEWPEALVQEIVDVVQTLDDGRNAVFLRVTCDYDKVMKEIVPGWAFLRADGTPLTGRAGRQQNTNPFFRALPVFSLAALRDASQEFSSRSQFWGALLRRVEVPEENKLHIQTAIDQLNTQIVSQDPLLSNIKGELGDVGKILAPSVAKEVDIRPLPIKTWDLMSRSELAVRGGEKLPWLPIERHGQGVQSLAVFYLFQAFAKIALGTSGLAEYSKAAEPVLTVEEPEAHLHPQATRALWAVVNSLIGQKIVSTHSPYFAQNAPFKSLRIVRRTQGGSTIYQLRDQYLAGVPTNEALQKVIAKHPDLLEYDASRQMLICKRQLEEQVCKQLMACFTESTTRDGIHKRLREMQNESASWLSPEDLEKLEDWARRIRGEIFFSRAWLLCEGQCEFFVIPALAEKLGFGFDANGISIIDYQNNGSPGAFVALAESLGFPWVITCDGDSGGTAQSEAAAARCPKSKAALTTKFKLPAADFEAYLLSGELATIVRTVATEFDSTTTSKSDVELAAWMRGRKTDFAIRLAEKIRADCTEALVPKLYKDLINELKVMIGSTQ